MNSSKNEMGLIRAILEETAPEDFRAHTLETLLAGVRDHRRAQRRRRLAVGVAAPLLVLLTLVWWADRFLASDRDGVPGQLVQGPAEPVASAPEVLRGTAIRVLSDEEFFALFPNRPIALVGPSDRPQVIFLDEL